MVHHGHRQPSGPRFGKTIRAYLNGERTPGVRARSAPDPLEPFRSLPRAALHDDPHVWASALFDEVVVLGYSLSYPSFARQVRLANSVRTAKRGCVREGSRHRRIPHPPGEGIQWDWFERRRTPWGGTLNVLLGTLHTRVGYAACCESMDQAHLIAAMDPIMRKLGGTTRDWRIDRLATVIVPGTREIQPSFAPVAKHYGCVVEACPPRRGNREGLVGPSVRFVSGRWWRTMTRTPRRRRTLPRPDP